MSGTKRGQKSPDRPNLRASVPESEGRKGFRAVGVAASTLAAPIIEKRGGGILTRLKTRWAEIVGSDWADVTWPTTVSRDGVLKLRAVSGAALEIQHRAPLLIERLNLFLGRRAITRLALVQGPLPLMLPSERPPLRPLTPGEIEALDKRLSDVTDPELRDALARLGKAVIGRER
jgi:hypothetical protein